MPIERSFMANYTPLNPSQRILMGPGPSDVHPRVYRALAAPVVGHLDPEFLQVMEDNKRLLQMVFQTANRLTLPISGTGSAGMEACLVNIVEPGDPVLVCINGVFGMRMKDVAERCGAEVTVVEAVWGEAIAVEQIEAALEKKAYKVVGIVHAETSTGVLQPLTDIAKIVRDSGALLLVDAVTSLGGIDLNVDGLGIDLCYSGTQKCLSCPPGLAPITFSERALDCLRQRTHKVQSWYLDLSMIEKYWGEERVYHHTAPISMNYALREALVLIAEEGLEQRWQRHWRNHQALVRGVEAMGLEMAVAPALRLPSLNAIKVPEGIDEALIRQQLLLEYSLEIGAGLGALKGKVWRVGLMGHASNMRNILLFLTALEISLGQQGLKIQRGMAAQAAMEIGLT
jgi:alanine-glyoxylate transaminase / serine-glyoxylate transaminase / serine-pyruvate transaminase